ncbi:MAG: SDR family NAD(P)-dependent oxidoreductase [bacterium]
MTDARADKFAVVTGTSSGIGAAVAAQLLEHGWTVAGIARRPSQLKHSRYTHLEIDLADAAALPHATDEHLVPRFRNTKWARVGLVNNAASVGPLVPVHKIQPAELLRLNAVNVAAPIWLMGVVSRNTEASVPLRVVNVSSGAAVSGIPGLAAYGSSKAALRLAGMVAAAEWQSTVAYAPTRKDVAVLSYQPGTVDTPMQGIARSFDAQEYPWVKMFRDFAEQGRLVPVALPAREIVEFLESNGQPPFAERRLKTT